MAYQHTKHSQLLNWSQVEGSGGSFGTPQWVLALLIHYKDSTLRERHIINAKSAWMVDLQWILNLYLHLLYELML